MAKAKKTVAPQDPELKELIGDAVRVEFKDMLKVAYAEHEAAFLESIKQQEKAATNAFNEAKTKMRIAEMEAQKAQRLLQLCLEKRNTLHELMRHRAKSIEFVYMIDNDGIIIDPNVRLTT